MASTSLATATAIESDAHGSEQDRIVIHQPGSAAPELSNGPNGFNRTWFMGTWQVIWSTLPMWKNKKDVLITYTPIKMGDDSVFESEVEYRARSSSSSKTSSVKGVERLTKNTNGATFDWRGNGLLKIASSHWEVLGTGVVDGYEWCATSFSKTLFTPAGLDLYVRRVGGGDVPDADKERLMDSVVPVIRQLKGQAGETAASGFVVP